MLFCLKIVYLPAFDYKYAVCDGAMDFLALWERCRRQRGYKIILKSPHPIPSRGMWRQGAYFQCLKDKQQSNSG